MIPRSLLRLHPARREDIGDLVTRSPMVDPLLPQMDPFLFLNHHGPQTYAADNRGLPFGPHPHRGFETVTFILEGSLAHADTGGHESVIDAGGVQWMTAGKGLIHAELSPAAFKRDGGPMEILQLWLNPPARLKMTEPKYTGLQRGDIPLVEAAPGVTVELVSGALGEAQGPIASLTDTFMSVVRLAPGAAAELPAPAGRTIFLYVVRGDLSVGGASVPEWHLAELGEGDAVQLASRDGAVLLFGHSAPLREPVAHGGPFVMNTPVEIEQAFRDYQAGMFGDPAALAGR